MNKKGRCGVKKKKRANASNALINRKATWVLGIAVVLTATFSLFTLRRPQQEPVEIFAMSAVVVNANNGRVLYEKSAHMPLLPSSITKLAALLPVFEAIEDGRLEFDTEITVSARAAGVHASRAGFLAGDVVTAYGLIMAAMLPSGSEAVMALGEYLFGSEEGFVEAMNEAAERLGMTNTHFTNSVGLDHEEHFMSAYDIAILARHFISYHPRIFEFTSREFYVYQRPNGVLIRMRNTNDMLRFDGVNGLKTGSGPMSGSSLVFTHERGRTMQVYVVLSSPQGSMRRHDTELLLRRFR